MDALEQLKELLAKEGYKLSDAAAAIKKLNKEASEQKAAEFNEKKEGNKDAMVDLMCTIQNSLYESMDGFLPGTHMNFTARVTKEGNLVVTANDCHASGYRDSFHLTPGGSLVTGEEGAEQAKNVRPRKSSN